MAGEREANYLTGNRVYRGASNAPKPGRKNPSGYVQRELQKTKKDSGKRSGKAAAMLRARDQLQGQPNGASPEEMQQPMIPFPLTPVGSLGIMKDPTGRLYYGSSPDAEAEQAQTAAQQSGSPASAYGAAI